MVKKLSLEDFPGGWIVGDFNPSLLVQREIEVAIKFYRAGDREPRHKQLIATEATFLVSGRAILADMEMQAGDGLVIPPGMPASFEAIEDCQLVAIKWPSLPGDKVICD